MENLPESRQLMLHACPLAGQMVVESEVGTWGQKLWFLEWESLQWMRRGLEGLPPRKSSSGKRENPGILDAAVEGGGTDKMQGDVDQKNGLGDGGFW
ncbi:hypothetical protein F2Q68_00012475 [Brassica cretica]|uniref:Uncharacterized protein n=1 Tax=Brassica cretica TaxID=69181 RepID=A0A8S9KQR0_BRACR|nr:hypothetical protein F2Q68_00012475 [Brassica cretica]